MSPWLLPVSKVSMDFQVNLDCLVMLAEAVRMKLGYASGALSLPHPQLFLYEVWCMKLQACAK